MRLQVPEYQQNYTKQQDPAKFIPGISINTMKRNIDDIRFEELF